jgi:hypothetical protein
MRKLLHDSESATEQCYILRTTVEKSQRGEPRTDDCPGDDTPSDFIQAEDRLSRAREQ